MTKPFDCAINQRTFIAVPPEEVYDAITSADHWDKFFTTGMELDPTPGGKCVFRWKDWGPDFYSLAADGRTVAAERPHRFAFQWYPAGKEEGTTITFSLEGKYGGTVLTITEDGYPDTPEGRRAILECASGWGEAATLLKFYMEHGTVYTPPRKSPPSGSHFTPLDKDSEEDR